VVTYAQGTANALSSTNSVSTSASVFIPSKGVLAGVNVPGSDGDLSGFPMRAPAAAYVDRPGDSAPANFVAQK
jgi:hypothetical protein